MTVGTTLPTYAWTAATSRPQSPRGCCGPRLAHEAAIPGPHDWLREERRYTASPDGAKRTCGRPDGGAANPQPACLPAPGSARADVQQAADVVGARRARARIAQSAAGRRRRLRSEPDRPRA